MKKMAAGLERFLALGCGLAALLSLGSLFEGGSPAALVLAAALLAAARGLSLLAERSERAALRARRRRQRTCLLYTSRAPGWSRKTSRR